MEEVESANVGRAEQTVRGLKSDSEDLIETYVSFFFT